MRSLPAVIACLALLGSTSTAQAAQRYASPTGAGEGCASAEPCSLKEAITKAKAGDEVIVTAGTYSVKEGLNPGVGVTNLYIHGDLGGPMPKIDADYGVIPIGNGEPGGRLEYLEVVNSAPLGGGVFCGPGARIDRVRVVVSGDNAVALNLGGSCEVRDSLIQAKSGGSVGVFAAAQQNGETGILRNVTVLAEAPDSIAVWSTYNAADLGSYTLDARNVIANGSKFDLYAFRAGHGLSGPGNIVVANSNFDSQKVEPGASISDAGSNQSAAPLFVDAAAGIYWEALNSPTIDAGGVKDQLGALDLAGNPRVLGPAPDIGAYESVLYPPKGQIGSLELSYPKFRTASTGEAIFSFKDKRLAPIGTTVTYVLSGPAQTEFLVEKKVIGRKVKGKCRARVTKANRKRKKCVVFRLSKTGFADSGAAGQNTFKFSGRIGGVALKPGGYRLRASAGGASRTASFKIVN